MEPITVSDLGALPPSIDLMTAAQMFGMGRTKAYELARKGQFPCKVVMSGCSYRVSSEDLIRVLGSDEAKPDRDQKGRNGPFRAA